MANNNQNSNGGGGGSIIAVILIILVLFGLLGSCGDGGSKYEDDLNSGWDKFSNGNYGDMSDDEKEAVNNFLEWSNDN